MGYVHLWSGTHPKLLEALKDSILNELYDTDGVILDLRDGAGGAWWDYLDLFYPNRSTYLVAQKMNGEGSSDLRVEAQINKKHYSKPLVVLINNNVRSGQEALAYQFKKDKRAVLIGTKTAGAFSGGEGGFSNENLNFIFYLSVFELLLDGNKIEGIGISPDIIASDDTALRIAQEKLLEIIR